MTDSGRLKTRSAGFTLLELMIVGAIVAVLAGIALPYYGDYVKRGQIQDGTAALSDVRVRMEQFFQDNKTYAGGVTCPAASKYFTYAGCELGDATTFTITATGIGSLAGFTYTINQLAARTSTTPAGWGGGLQPCWITKKGDTC